MRESKIEEYLREKVETILKGKCFKWVCPQVNGVTDRIILLHREIWFVETKCETGKLSKLQIWFKNILLSYELNYATLYSREEVDRWISDRLRAKSR